MDKKTIKQINKSERPREKLILCGASNLSNEELLAILIDTGTKDKNAIEIAKDLIEFAGDLSNLAKFDVNMIAKTKGIGIAKSCKIVASIEFANRVVKSSSLNNKESVTSPEQLINMFSLEFESLNVEVFKLICLNTKNHIIYEKNITVGVANASLITPRELYKEAMLRHATSIIAMHNHPSKNPTPSEEDIHLTKKLVEAGNCLDIKLVDHIIYGSVNNYYSFKQNNGI